MSGATMLDDGLLGKVDVQEKAADVGRSSDELVGMGRNKRD